MAKITLTLADGTELSHELTEDLVTIGRVSDNVIHLNDVSVSSHHAEILSTGNHHILKDLNSTNGTRVNDHSFYQGPPA